MSTPLGLSSSSDCHVVVVNTFAEAVNLHNVLLAIYERHRYLRYKGVTIFKSDMGNYTLKYKLLSIYENEFTEQGTENYRRSEFFKHTQGVYKKGEE